MSDNCIIRNLTNYWTSILLLYPNILDRNIDWLLIGGFLVYYHVLLLLFLVVNIFHLYLK